MIDYKSSEYYIFNYSFMQKSKKLKNEKVFINEENITPDSKPVNSHEHVDEF